MSHHSLNNLGIKPKNQKEGTPKADLIKRIGYALTEKWREKLSRAKNIKGERLSREAIIKREREEKKFESYKNFINQEIEDYIKPFIEEIKESNKNIEKRNKKCPNCSSWNVVDRIWNTIWSVHGEVHWSWYVGWWLFYTHGSSHVHWSVDWKTETLPVCHCNDCSNERIKNETKSAYLHDILESKDYIIWFFIDDIEDYLQWKYEDNLIYNEKTRKEKAYQQLLDKIKDEKEKLKNLSIETLAYLYGAARKTKSYYIDDTYRYRFPKNVIEILQKLWFKYWFEES